MRQLLAASTPLEVLHRELRTAAKKVISDFPDTHAVFRNQLLNHLKVPFTDRSRALLLLAALLSQRYRLHVLSNSADDIEYALRRLTRIEKWYRYWIMGLDSHGRSTTGEPLIASAEDFVNLCAQ